VIRGWTAVIVFTTLAVVMMIGVNVRMWRRMFVIAQRLGPGLRRGTDSVLGRGVA
jgi:hypothetical protein